MAQETESALQKNTENELNKAVEKLVAQAKDPNRLVEFKRLRSLVKRLDGVDISPEMAAVAESKGVYEVIEVADLVDFLSRKHEAYDLIVSAAVLFHFRALDKVLTVMANALRRSGQLIFTVFKSSDGTSRLNEHNFFEHPWLEIEAAVISAGLTPVSVTEAIHEYSSDDEPRECFCVRCHFE